ncbi:MAG: NAD(P)-dependent alcohol dehydrogenase [Saprospiraceae bacterium]|nr:NAD(P)-dependent alcohol dehydrogenase [Saprospiraceae bacterium]
MEMMKAVLFKKYGSPELLELGQIPIPVPKDNDLLIKVHTTSVTSGEIKIRSFRNITPIFWLPFRLGLGIFRPRKAISVLGFEFSGTINKIGKDVKNWKIGDQVLGFKPFAANAEFLCIPSNGIVVKKPIDIGFVEAAAIPFGALNALHFLRLGKLEKGQKILINGASGLVGTAAIQLAKHMGAKVTGTCSSKNINLIKSLGADHVIDYSKEQFWNKKQKYDLIFDLSGKLSITKAKKALKKEGKLLLAVFGLYDLLQNLWTKFFSRKKVHCSLAVDKQEDLEYIVELVKQGILKPTVDRIFPLEKTSEAHQYFESGQKQGNVIIKVSN